jgi:hypothetical protein
VQLAQRKKTGQMASGSARVPGRQPLAARRPERRAGTQAAFSQDSG